MDHAHAPLTHATTFSADAFIAWLTDPARTNEALFTAEDVIVSIHASALADRGIYHDNRSPDVEHRQRKRRLNPAYRPTATLPPPPTHPRRPHPRPRPRSPSTPPSPGSPSRARPSPAALPSPPNSANTAGARASFANP